MIPVCYPPSAMAAAKPLSKTELKDIRAALLKERGELVSQLTEIEEDTFSEAETSAESGLDEEFADAGSITLERESALSIENNVKDLMAKIDGALERIDAGTYGTCERCGKQISKERIRALPYANLCIKDAEEDARLR